jgi:hypothetical protein
VGFRAKYRTLATFIAFLLAGQQDAFALLNIDGTRNQVFVFGELVLAYDSNVFAQNASRGDYMTNASLGVELKRRAGIIAVNARGVIEYQRFGEFTDQNAWNPSFLLEFNKTTGRTTGALTVNAYRSAKADSAVNLRTTSWNFPVGLSIKYPVNDKLYLTSQTNYLSRRFANASATGLSNYLDYSEGIDAFYVYTSKLDLLGGYRIRISETDRGRTTDHNFSLGATGGLFAKINGTLRAGYQLRQDERTSETFNQWSMLAALTWNATRKLTATAQVVRDFSTTATSVNVDTFSTTLRTQYSFTRRFLLDGGVGYGRNRFLGRDQLPRRDEFFSWDAGATFVWNEHLRVSGTYTYLRNWSTLAFSDFQRHGYSLDVSSRF